MTQYFPATLALAAGGTALLLAPGLTATAALATPISLPPAPRSRAASTLWLVEG